MTISNIRGATLIFHVQLLTSGDAPPERTGDGVFIACACAGGGGGARLGPGGSCECVSFIGAIGAGLCSGSILFGAGKQLRCEWKGVQMLSVPLQSIGFICHSLLSLTGCMYEGNATGCCCCCAGGVDVKLSSLANTLLMLW